MGKSDTIFEVLYPFVLLVAHSDAVTCVASCPGKDTVFLSCAEVKLTLLSKSTPFKRDLTLGIYSLMHVETISCVTCLPVLLQCSSLIIYNRFAKLIPTGLYGILGAPRSVLRMTEGCSW